MAQDQPRSENGRPPPEMMKLMRSFVTGKLTIDELPAPFVDAMTKMMKRSKAELADWAKRRGEREQGSPKPGALAPEAPGPFGFDVDAWEAAIQEQL